MTRVQVLEVRALLNQSRQTLDACVFERKYSDIFASSVELEVFDRLKRNDADAQQFELLWGFSLIEC